MVGWGTLTDKEVVVYYDDKDKINRKQGLLQHTTKEDLFLKTLSGVIVIPFSRIIRVEEVKNGI